MLLQVNNFLSEDECDALITKASEGLTQQLCDGRAEDGETYSQHSSSQHSNSDSNQAAQQQQSAQQQQQQPAQDSSNQLSSSSQL